MSIKISIWVTGELCEACGFCDDKEHGYRSYHCSHDEDTVGEKFEIGLYQAGLRSALIEEYDADDWHSGSRVTVKLECDFEELMSIDVVFAFGDGYIQVEDFDELWGSVVEEVEFAGLINSVETETGDWRCELAPELVEVLSNANRSQPENVNDFLKACGGDTAELRERYNL